MRGRAESTSERDVIPFPSRTPSPVREWGQVGVLGSTGVQTAWNQQSQYSESQPNVPIVYCLVPAATPIPVADGVQMVGWNC